MSWHSLGHQGQNSFVLFIMWLTQMARYLPWPASSNLFFSLFPPLERVWQHMSLSAERVWGSHADDPQAIKTSRGPCLSKLHLLLQCYIFFADSIEDWFDLTYDLQSSPKLAFLCSAFSFQDDSLIWPLHRSLQGQRAKGSCRKDGGEKNHTGLWAAEETGANTQTVRPFSGWWAWLARQKVKVGAVELYINHRLLGGEQHLPGPRQRGVQGHHSGRLVSPATAVCCICSPENGTIA